MAQISPSQHEWYISEDTRLFFCSGAAVTSQKLATAARLEGPRNDEFENANRFFKYEAGQWTAFNIGDNIVSMIPFAQAGQQRTDNLAMLSAEGNVYFVGDSGRKERIAGAGVWSDDARGYGYVNRLRLFEDRLYVVGDAGQIYCREPAGSDWRPFRPDIKQVVDETIDQSKSPKLDLDDICVLPHGPIYVCGKWRFDSAPPVNALLMLEHESAPDWRQIRMPTRPDPLHALLADGATLYIAGSDVLFAIPISTMDGASVEIRSLYNLSQRAGFEDLVKYKGEIYAGSAQGVAKLMGDAFQFIAIDEANRVSPRNLQVLGDDLWIFGYRGIAKYDGREASKIPFPSVYR